MRAEGIDRLDILEIISHLDIFRIRKKEDGDGEDWTAWNS